MVILFRDFFRGGVGMGFGDWARRFWSNGVLCLSLLLMVLGCGHKADDPPRSRRLHISAPRPKSWSKSPKVVLIILENTDYDLAVAQPFFGELIQKGAVLTHYNAIVRQSQPNYIALTSGSTFGVNNESVSLEATHLGDLLEQRNKTWKNYAEGYPGNCFLGASYGTYVRRHVPFLSYKNIQDDFARCTKVVNARQFLIDLKNKSLPEFSLYIPDIKNDGHDTGVAFADQWLAHFFKPILENESLLQEVIFVVTFDEVSIGSAYKDDRVATVFFGAGVKPGAKSNQDYDHFCLLRTLEEIFELPTLGRHDQSADPIDDIWN